MEQRTVQVHRNMQWKEINFRDLHKGDNFKMIEPNGDSVINTETGFEIFYALSDPFYDETLRAWKINIAD